jgi:hypothetical protein
MRQFLSTHRDGAIEDTEEVGRLLAAAWDGLDGHDRTKMRADKLWRIDSPIWQPPCLSFSIERHGATVNGSSRAAVHRWSVDVESMTARIIEEKVRQLTQMDQRLDVGPIAQSLADAIVSSTADTLIKTLKDVTKKLDMDLVIPATNKQTTGARRARLRRELDAILDPLGWKAVRANVYKRASPADEPTNC